TSSAYTDALPLPDALPISMELTDHAAAGPRHVLAARLGRRAFAVLRVGGAGDVAERLRVEVAPAGQRGERDPRLTRVVAPRNQRSEEHTSELQSRENLVCR